MHHSEVNWPKGFAPFLAKVRANAQTILNGTLVAIDPSSGGSSLPGYAVYKAGELLTSGEITFPRKLDVYARLQYLYDEIRKLADPDLLAIEEIRGKDFSHIYLRWAVGTSIAAARAPTTIEVPIVVWRQLAKATDGYIKGNAMDAELQGQTLILLAQKFSEELESAS